MVRFTSFREFANDKPVDVSFAREFEEYMNKSILQSEIAEARAVESASKIVVI